MKTIATFGMKCAAIFIVMAMVISIIPLNGIISTVSAAVPKGPAPVDLGTAGDFVILAKSGISTTGTTLITGDIGVSPIDRTALTGFSETMDSTNWFSTSIYVVGKLYAADYTDPTPAKMTTAISDMETAYVDAAGRTLPNATELGAGDISGMTLVPGLYKWSTGVDIDNTGVTLSGASNDVWIFQIAQDLTLADGAVVTLSGGARDANIFWQVGGGTGVTLEINSVMHGNILAMNAIIIKNKATLNGSALAQKAVTLDANPITEPSELVSDSDSYVNPISPYWKTTSPQTITATGNANTNSIELYYRYSANKIAWGSWNMFGNDSAAPWSWSFTFTNGTGFYEFYTRAWNNTGGGREAAPRLADARCAYDNIAPTSSLNAIGTYWKNTSPLTITATAADATSGIKNVSISFRYAADNTTWGAWTAFGVDLKAPWSWNFTFPSGAGHYQFNSRAYDYVTNFEAAPGIADQICGYDNTSATSDVNDLASFWKNTSPLTVTATAADATSGLKDVALYFRYAADNATWGAWTTFGVDTAAPWTWSFAFPNGTGYYQFYSRAHDNVTNFEAAPLVADQIGGYDNTVPTSSVNAMSPYWKNKSPAENVTATATDATSGVKDVTLFYRFSADNTTWGVWTSFGVNVVASWSWSFNFPNGNGYYELYTTSADKAGNAETAPTAADVKIAYDADKPVIGTDTTPITATTGETLTFNIVITDNINVTDAKVMYRFGTSAWVNQTLTLSGTYQYGLVLPAPATLPVEYYFYASDIAGNWLISPTKTVQVLPIKPTTPPTLIILGPANGLLMKDIKNTVHGTANSTTDTVAKIDWALDNATWTSCTGTTVWSCIVNISAGSNKVTIRATDSVGNKGYKEVTLSLDQTVPTLTITGLKANSTVKKPKLPLSGTSTDANGIAKVEVRVNGGAWQTASGTTAWTYNATLKSGTNIIDVRTTDKAGNVVTKTETVTYKKAVAKGFIPGFEALIVVAATVVAVAVVANKRKN
jgi:hypothetical protein